MTVTTTNRHDNSVCPYYFPITSLSTTASLPHQSLGYKTPEVVYRTAIDGGALIVDKFPRAAEGIPVEHSGTDGSTAAARSKATPTATYKVTGKPGQRRPSASEVKCAA
jgi:putative transposase